MNKIKERLESISLQTHSWIATAMVLMGFLFMAPPFWELGMWGGV